MWFTSLVGTYARVFREDPAPALASQDWIHAWAPVAANVATLATATLAIIGGFIALRKYVGENLLHPQPAITVAATIQGASNLLYVKITVENKGIRTIRIRGNSSWDSVEPYSSYVYVAWATESELSEDDFSWSSEQEFGSVLDSDTKGLWVDNQPPSEVPRSFNSLLRPKMAIDLPYVFWIPDSAAAAMVRPQLYVEDRGGRYGGFYGTSEVAHRAVA